MSKRTVFSVFDRLEPWDETGTRRKQPYSPLVSREAPSLILANMPEEILCTVGSFLDVKSLSVCRQLNRKYCFLFSLDQVGWSSRCQELWARRVHVDSQAIALLGSKISVGLQASAMYAYLLSCHDARFRRHIRLEELCFDVKNQKGTIWDFRFKEAAGPEWILADPWYAGQQARRLIFLRSGTVKQIIINKDVDGEHPPSIELLDPFFDSHDGGLVVHWKFIEKPLDLPKRVQGTYIRLNVADRDLPTYVVQRSPNGNWGFLLENCWGVFASFELPPKRGPRAMAGTIFRIVNHRHGRETRRQDTEVSEDEEAGEHRVCKRKRTSEPGSSLLEDESLPVTSDCQWREALLYNLGASRLPDGDPDSDIGTVL